MYTNLSEIVIEITERCLNPLDHQPLFIVISFAIKTKAD